MKMESTAITKAMIDKLKSTDSVSRTNQISDLIECRIGEIVENIMEVFNIKNGWWSWEYYDNDSRCPEFEKSYINNDSVSFGIFDCHDPVILLKDGTEWGLNEGCPLRWLWEDYSEELSKGKILYKEKIESEKNKKNARVKELKDLKAKYKSDAIAKLNLEERWACGLGRLPQSLKQYKDIQQ